jgi:hypothetical protein
MKSEFWIGVAVALVLSLFIWWGIYELLVYLVLM